MSGQKASLGYLRNDREMNITNSWIFLALNIYALNISNLFSIDMLDTRRIDIYLIQEFVVSMHQASQCLSLAAVGCPNMHKALLFLYVYNSTLCLHQLNRSDMLNARKIQEFMMFISRLFLRYPREAFWPLIYEYNISMDISAE